MKTALVTGGSRGIGRAVVQSFLCDRMHVVYCSRRPEEIKGAIHIAANLTPPSTGAAGLAKALDDMCFHPDIVVHCVGGTLGIRAEFPTSYEWTDVWSLNFETVAAVDSLIIPKMIERGGGRVIVIGSLAGHEDCDGSVPYGAAKAALAAYVRMAGRRHKDRGVIVCGVQPGRVQTEASPNGTQEPGEIAEVVRFLAQHPWATFAGCMVPADAALGRAF